MNNTKSGPKFKLILILAAVVLAVGGYFLLRDTDPPALSLLPNVGRVSPDTVLTLKAEDLGLGLKDLEVRLVQKGKKTRLLAKDFAQGEPRFSTDLTLSGTEILEGPFEIEIEARDRSLYPLGQAGRSRLVRNLVLDATPPRISVESGQHNLNQGGSGLVVYKSDEDLGRTGVLVGERFFPGYRQTGDKDQNRVYACLFAMPYDTPPAEFNPRIVARDLAGNERLRAIPVHANARAFRLSKINVSDQFLEQKMPEFRKFFPNAPSLLDVFLKVNRELRVENRARLKEIGLDTSPTPMWEGPFLRLPNSATMAGFGDRREYLSQGKMIDEQTHLGIDLASVKNAPIPAANNGMVVHTGYLGIYGDAVIIDHGLGLQSLYAHLSETAVNNGDNVSRGQIIGRTGVSGLAGGDHLHFGILVSGLPVQPREWWDATWMRNNVDGKLGR
ncbi:MAG: M23 family metallopeptidase [Desulfovibrionaceae bacterium]|nr:M23 family metallopeptidase [Desulfovibrionaceae bacterium]